MELKDFAGTCNLWHFPVPAKHECIGRRFYSSFGKVKIRLAPKDKPELHNRQRYEENFNHTEFTVLHYTARLRKRFLYW